MLTLVKIGRGGDGMYCVRLLDPPFLPPILPLPICLKTLVMVDDHKWGVLMLLVTIASGVGSSWGDNKDVLSYIFILGN